jgi:hypothetical protein
MMTDKSKVFRRHRGLLHVESDKRSDLCPTFLEGVGANHRMRSRRLTLSRKVGGAPNLR